MEDHRKKREEAKKKDEKKLQNKLKGGTRSPVNLERARTSLNTTRRKS
tara:strand:+ start:333 stop:476 length:144 start_codon:yes stop_codon:yes gene_type:complete